MNRENNVVSRTKQRLVVGATVLVSALGATGVASAATLVYFEGLTTGRTGPRHSLTETSVRLNSGNWGCTWAINMDGSSAGGTACTTSTGGAVTHSYGGTLRYPACGTPKGTGASRLRCRADW